MSNPTDQRRTCANCGHDHPATDVDVAGWCQRCRARLVRRSRLVARLVAFLFTLVMALLIYGQTRGDSGFLLGYVIFVVVSYFLVARITQRVAFEMLRARGVSPPPSGS